jgi:phage terminase large subunit
MTLSETQTEALDYLEDQTTNEVLIGGGAGGGKSALICYFGLKQSLKYPGARGLLGRAVLKTLRETTLNTFFDIAKKQNVAHTYRYISSPSSMIKFHNGSEILLKDLYAYPQDPEFDELGSLELTWAAVDECNQITAKAKSILRSRIRHRLQEFGIKPKLALSCNPAKNWVKKDFYTPHTLGKLRKNYKFVQSLVDDNPFIDPSYKGSLEELDKTSRERLLLGNWDYSSDPASLIELEAIADIFSNDYVTGTKRFITIDVARKGTDKTVIRVWHGWRSVYRFVESRSSIPGIAAKVREIMSKHQVPLSHVICDEDGVGGGVVDMLNCKGFVANASPFQHDKNNVNYDSVKSQCAWHLARMINAGLVCEAAVVAADELTEELEYIKQRDVDKDGKRRLQSKDLTKLALGRSPDDADTYIMRAWFDLAKLSGPSFINGSAVSEKSAKERTNYSL